MIYGNTIPLFFVIHVEGIIKETLHGVAPGPMGHNSVRNGSPISLGYSFSQKNRRNLNSESLKMNCRTFIGGCLLGGRLIPHFLIRDKTDVIVFIFGLVAFIVGGVVLFASPHR